MQTRHAVLFDLDGTLLDTAPDLAGAINELRADRGLEHLPLAELAPMCSLGGRGMLSKGLGLTPADADYADMSRVFIERYHQRMSRETAPFAGMRELIRTIAANSHAWGVVTNKAEALALPLMDAMAFDPAPGCVIGGDSAGIAKPDPAPLFMACEQLGVNAADCIYIGDSERDIAAGRNAGMATIGVTYGYIPPDDDIHAWQANILVNTVAELPVTIEQLIAQIAPCPLDRSIS